MTTDPFDPNRSENRSWLSLADITGDFAHAPVALIGAPLGAGSITPGGCDKGPETLRATLRRLSVYDLESGTDLSALRVRDLGDVAGPHATPEHALSPIRGGVQQALKNHALVILCGGNNAITRPGVHGVDPSLKNVGLVTLDAHFDLRDTDGGLNNGNPIQALLDDGMPGAHIAQIGLAPFANTKKAHAKAKAAGIAVHTLADCRERGTANIVAAELARLAKLCERIYVDCDIDVIDRGAFPAAPGARPGGISANEFFACARMVGAHPKVACIDLAEFDPSLDVGQVGALTAARWYAEVLAGFVTRR